MKVMKTRNIILKTSAILLSACILVTACKKDSNSSSSTASNSQAASLSSHGASADNAYDDAFNVGVQSGNDNGINSLAPLIRGGIVTNGTTVNGGGNHYYCATVTASGSVFPITLTVDFGSGCMSADSITRSGSITYVFSDSLYKPGTTVSATFNNYVVNGYKLGGTYSFTNNSSLSAGIVFTTTVTNGSITLPNDTTYTFSKSKTVTQTAGQGSLDLLTYAFNITGTYSISSSYGESLTATVTKPLVREGSCKNIVAGTASFTYTKGSSSVSGTFDYGDGSCDNLATITIGAFVKVVTL